MYNEQMFAELRQMLLEVISPGPSFAGNQDHNEVKARAILSLASVFDAVEEVPHTGDEK